MAFTAWTRVAIVAAAMLAASGTARAQATLDADTLSLFGGTYSTDCAKPDAPKLRAVAEMISVERGDQRLAGRNPQAAAAFFGRSPPRDFQIALIGEVRGGLQLLFLVFKDGRGQYVTIDGDPKVRQALGQALLAGRYRRCDAPAAAAPAANPAATPTPNPTPAPTPAPAQAAQPAPTETSPVILLRDPRFKTPYFAALGAKSRERWLARLDGPAPQPRMIKVADSDWLLLAVCKAHDCGENNMVLLYAAGPGIVHGQIYERGRKTLIGAPPPAVAAELDKLWRSEWRQ